MKNTFQFSMVSGRKEEKYMRIMEKLNEMLKWSGKGRKHTALVSTGGEKRGVGLPFLCTHQS
jgi:hypothetical protein